MTAEPRATGHGCRRGGGGGGAAGGTPAHTHTPRHAGAWGARGTPPPPPPPPAHDPTSASIRGGGGSPGREPTVTVRMGEGRAARPGRARAERRLTRRRGAPRTAARCP